MAIFPKGKDADPSWEHAYTDADGNDWYRPKLAGYLTGAPDKSDPSKVGVTIKTTGGQ